MGAAGGSPYSSPEGEFREWFVGETSCAGLQAAQRRLLLPPLSHSKGNGLAMSRMNASKFSEDSFRYSRRELTR
jgi:hypothetical protein